MISGFYPSENDYTVLNRAQLTPGSYTPTELCVELQTQMNAQSFFGSSAYTVTYSTTLHNATITLTAAGDSTFTNYHGFIPVSGRVLTDSAIQTYASVRQLTNSSGNAYPSATPTAYAINYGDPESAGELFSMDYSEDPGFRAVSLLLTLNAHGTGTTFPKSYTSGEVDVRNVHTLYVHSNALTTFQQLD